VAFLKIIDEQTRNSVEEGEWRLLLVDGHNSHYTRGFLQYACENQIAVLCYPAHTTHVYQGLDVVIFSILKKNIGDERRAYEKRTGIAMSKMNFLEIYGNAHLKTMTEENIKMAFCKTGTWSVNPDVITPEMMAPAKVTSKDSHLPVIPPTPVQVLADMLDNVSQLLVKDDLDSDDSDNAEFIEEDNMANPFLDAPAIDGAVLEPIAEVESKEVAEGAVDGVVEGVVETERERTVEPAGSSEEGKGEGEGTEARSTKARLNKAEECIQNAVKQLTESSLMTLVQTSSLSNTALSQPLILDTALASRPRTKTEKILYQALLDTQELLKAQTQRYLKLQAVSILNATYCKSLAEKLAIQENRSKMKKKTLMNDGLPVLLTDDFFYEKVVEHEAAMKKKDDEKRARQVERARKAKEGEAWQREKARRERANNEQRERYKAALAKWAARKEEWAAKKKAKLVKGKFPHTKPKLGQLLSLTKPKDWEDPLYQLPDAEDIAIPSSDEESANSSDHEGDNGESDVD
jgi:hypothetical protein